MSVDLDHRIVEALEALAPLEPVEADWDDALARARDNGRRSPDKAVLAGMLEPSSSARRRAPWRPRRRLLVSLVACLLVFGLLIATGAGGLRDTIINLFESGEPAPTKVVKTFALFDVGAPEGMATNVIPGQARKVLEVQATPKRWLMMWAAPTRGGGFCTLVQWRGIEGKTKTATGGCVQDRDRLTLPIWPTIAYPSYLSGFVTDQRAESLELVFADNQSTELPVTWISPPINAGLFLYPIPAEHRQSGQEPAALIVRDAEGQTLHREDIAGAIAAAQPRACDPLCDADLTRKRVFKRITTERGIPVTAWTAPAADGEGRYRWLTWNQPDNVVYAGPEPENGLPPTNLGVGFWHAGGKNAALILVGPVGSGVSTVEVRYENGERAHLKPTEGFVLSEVPSSHYTIGKRPALLVGLDQQGREVARQRLDTRTPGLYPCDEPKQIDEDADGKPLLACP